MLGGPGGRIAPPLPFAHGLLAYAEDLRQAGLVDAQMLPKCANELRIPEDTARLTPNVVAKLLADERDGLPPKIGSGHAIAGVEPSRGLEPGVVGVIRDRIRAERPNRRGIIPAEREQRKARQRQRRLAFHSLLAESSRRKGCTLR